MFKKDERVGWTTTSSEETERISLLLGTHRRKEVVPLPSGGSLFLISKTAWLHLNKVTRTK